MFRLDVLETDAFMDMPLTTQALYFHLNLRADDDGFIGNPNQIVRLIGASMDDLKLLIAKRFVIAFEDGVIVIKHWRMHNTLSAYRYKETNFIEDKALLKIKENKAYSLTSGDEICDERLIEIAHRQTKDNTKTTLEENRREENSIGKDSIDLTIINDSSSDSKSDLKQKVTEMWNELSAFGIPPVKRITEGSTRNIQLNARLKQYSLDDFRSAINEIKQSSFLKGQNKSSWIITFDWFIKPSNFQKVLEGNYNDKKEIRNVRSVQVGIEKYSSGNAERDRELTEIVERIQSGDEGESLF